MSNNNNSEVIRVDISDKHKNNDFSDIYTNRRNIVDSYNENVLATIAIVAYNRLDITRLCVESVLKYTADIDYKLVLVYNESEQGEGILDYFRSVSCKNKVIIHMTENLGAPIAYQQISRYIEGKYFVHLPNDVIVTKNWLSNLIKCAESDITIGMVNPVSSNVSNYQQADIKFHSYDEMQSAAAEYNVSDPLKWQERIRLVTLGTLFTRECLSAVGNIFDIGFTHYFGDDDISFCVRRAGYKVILAADTWVHHAHEDIFINPEQRESGLKIFKQKYPGIDAWEDTLNYVFHLIGENISMPSDMDNTKILGIDVKCGEPVLDIKNIIRQYGAFNTELSAFTQDAKYVADLKTICNGDVVCDRAEFLFDSFRNKFFDYIIIGDNINEYSNPIKTLSDVYAMLSQNGQLFFSLKNTYNVFVLYKMLGFGISYNEKALPCDADDFYAEIKKMGYNVELINYEGIDADNSVIELSSKIIDFAGFASSDKENVLKRMLINKYWFKVSKN